MQYLFNLPKWILNDTRFHHQPGFEKVNRFTFQKDIGNYKLCMQNQIEKLRDYTNEDYGPLDSFSGCTTLLCQIKDNKKLGLASCGVPGILNEAMNKRLIIFLYSVFLLSMIGPRIRLTSLLRG
jgi:hypothetical protein